MPGVVDTPMQTHLRSQANGAENGADVWFLTGLEWTSVLLELIVYKTTTIHYYIIRKTMKHYANYSVLTRLGPGSDWTCRVFCFVSFLFCQPWRTQDTLSRVASVRGMK